MSITVRLNSNGTNVVHQQSVPMGNTGSIELSNVYDDQGTLLTRMGRRVGPDGETERISFSIGGDDAHRGANTFFYSANQFDALAEMRDDSGVNIQVSAKDKPGLIEHYDFVDGPYPQQFVEVGDALRTEVTDFEPVIDPSMIISNGQVVDLDDHL